MKMNHLLATMKTCLLVSAGVLLASCADTYDGNDTFVSSVQNATLESPKEAEITITPSTDGSSMEVSWPVVYGAGGYEFKLLNAANESTPIVTRNVDGCKVTVSREEDMNYKILIRTLGNAALNNTEASSATVKEYSTFTESYASIPVGDIYEYFQQNPIPETETGELNFDMTPGGQYTLSQPLDLNYHKVVLRSTDKSNHPTITIAADANFVVSNDFTLKYIDVDASLTEKPVMEAFKYEVAPDGILEKPKNYYLINFVRIMSCNFKGVVGSLYYDNNKAYAVVNFLIQNSIIEMNTTTERIKNEAFLSFQGGGVKDFSIKSSTVYQKGSGNSKYFMRYNNSVRIDRLGYPTSDHTTLTYTNNTFYKVASGQWSNYSGISNYSIYDLRSNIWYESGDGQIARRIMGNGRLGNNCSFNSSYNTYWKNGAVADQANYDTSITQLTTDPAFVDPDNGDFTITGAEQVENKTGDPRWLK